MLDKERVKELYLNGYNAVEIAKLLKANKEAVRKCIQRNYNYASYKEAHEIALTARREEKRAINRESTRFISDKSFIMKNRSIYKTLANGDIVLDKVKAGTVTWDTPRRLVNENKYA